MKVPLSQVRDAVHAAGTKVPKDLTPPSERLKQIPNRAARRRARKRKS